MADESPTAINPEATGTPAAETLPWPGAAHAGSVIVRVAQELAGGQLVALPTDTSYVLAANALVPEAVDNLAEYAASDSNPGMVLAVRGAGDALDWVPA